jgi:hypothetical protein
MRRLEKLRSVFFALLLLAMQPAALAGWVVVGERGTILYSADGNTWTAATSNTTQTLRGVSSDASGQWVAAGQSGTIVASTDAQTWGETVSGNADALWGTAFAGGQWIVSGGMGRIVTSPNGTDWTSVNGRYSFTLLDIAYDSSSLFAMSGSSTQGGKILTSPDGITWTQHPPSTPGGSISEALYGIEYGNSLWVVVGDAGTIVTSNDPTTRSWEAKSSTTTVDLRDIVYNGSNLYVVVGRDGTILTSTDATTWTSQVSGTPFDLWGIAYDGGQYVAVGEEGVILTSSDAVTWAHATSPTSNFRLLYDITSGKLPQTIDFPSQNSFFQSGGLNTTYSISPLAVASSGLPVSYSVLSAGICNVAGTTVTIVALGECKIQASQAGNDDYLPAAPVTQSVLHIASPGAGVPTKPGLVFDPQDIEVFAKGKTFTLSPGAFTSQTLANLQPQIAYASNTPSVCTIPFLGSLEVTMLSVGDCVIVAASEPTTYYLLGGPIAATIQIIAPAQAKAVPTLPPALLGLLTLLMLAMAGFGLQRR